MPTEIKSKPKAIVFWILSAAVMAIVFWLSSNTAYDSAQQSGWLMELIKKIISGTFLTEHIIRKIAHFTEFALLGFLFNFSFLFTYGKPKRIISLSLTSLYALTDEIHQIFVEGRSCQFIDWVIDTCGAAAGLLAFAVLMWIINKCLKHKTKI